ncbi:MAG: Asp-tRNA(Asn)/Glu-tRNA(Gln) amidotransferase subunit GatC [Planctomycetota bacterium]|nr:MAG: Asp-tRNA(Asn)/Glu-tRNA(Gln) amidotransferase subunit GatC [Planctomycetota bacterium]REJ93279.1 MAG: Asp-tRNA(Asn)/Glu-tRNA(Gln) amidotransferase subunit GatC [Planctomycetota bacterium]
MSLSASDVEKVSLLARLLLTPQEIEALTSQLGQIVEYVDQLGEIDTEQVEPLAHAVELVNVWADDEVRPSLPRDEVLGGAPHRDEDSYLVPAVLGD